MASADFAAEAKAYILQNPETIEEAFRLRDKQQRIALLGEERALLEDKQEELFGDPDVPSAGNPTGDIILVEFFDYNCPYCRQAAPIIKELLKADAGIKILYREWPILGPGSRFAAEAALASRRQGMYESLHEALMSHSGAIDENSTLEIAAQLGIDLVQLRQDMEDPEIEAALDRNFQLAQDLRITGTPTFVLQDAMIRGFVELPQLQAAIAQARDPRD